MGIVFSIYLITATKEWLDETDDNLGYRVDSFIKQATDKEKVYTLKTIQMINRVYTNLWLENLITDKSHDEWVKIIDTLKECLEDRGIKDVL